jgi:protein O-mannosyl-transferase
MPTSSGTSSISLPSARLASLWPYLVLALAAFLAYFNVYENTFLLDDEFLLIKNTWLQGWDHLGDIFVSSTTAGAGGYDSFYRPLQIFSYFLLYKFFGLSTVAVHAFNVLLHAVNACLVFALATRLGLQRLPALFATLLWVAHPIHTEAVTYMSATADPLHVGFVLGALLAWKSDNFRAQALSAGLFILGLLAKETAVVFPALLLVTLSYNRQAFWSRTHLQTWPLWLTAVLYLAARGTILDLDDTYQFYPRSNVYTESVFVRFFTFLGTLPGYFQLLLAPLGLHMERNTPVYIRFDHPAVMTGAVLLAVPFALLAATLKNRKNSLLWALLFAFAWFFAAYFPCSGIVIPVNSFFLEHWMYLPSIGLVLGGALLLMPVLENKKTLQSIAGGATCIALFFLFLLTWQQNITWRDPITFYSYILRFEPGSARVHNNIAMAYDAAGQNPLARTHYEHAIAIDDTYAQTHHNLARLLLKSGQKEEAVKHLKRALEINPRFAPSTELLKNLH